MGLRVFEVDHPATQEWKLQRLGTAGISIPNLLTFVAADFERQRLAEALRHAGFDSGGAAFFSWLGVTMYLERETVLKTLRWIGSGGAGGGVAFDYIVPRAGLRWAQRFVFDAMARRVRRAGEPFRTFFVPGEITAELTRIGFHSIETLGGSDMNAGHGSGRTDCASRACSADSSARTYSGGRRPRADE